MQSIRNLFWGMGLTFRHMGKWLVSSSGDLVYPNPNFKAPISEISADEVPNTGKGVAVYCIHGTADRVSAFTLLAERSVGNMPDEISGFNLISFEKRGRGYGIEEFAEQLAQKILANGDRDVVLIGHSRGGLVAAYLTEYLAKKYDIRVRAVITMASPFGGSYLALPPLTFSESVKQMQPNSEFLEDLNSKILLSESEYFYFAAKKDWIVHAEATHVPGKGILTTLDTGHDHITMMSSHQLVKEVNHCLRKVTASQDDMEDEWSEDEFDVEAEMKAFTVVAMPTPLEFACEKLQKEIEDLPKRFHLFSAVAKLKVLTTLRERLLVMIEEGRDKAYPEAKTIGEYVAAFMQDEAMGNGKKPADILSAALNNPLGVSFYGAVQSQAFVSELIEIFSDEPLPQAEEKTYRRQLAKSS